MAVLDTDTFAGRTASNGLGTASDGSIWSMLVGSTPSLLSVSSGEGRVAYDNGSNVYTTLLGSTTSKDMEGLVRATPAAVGDTFGVVLRAQAANTYYALRYSNGQLQLYKTVSGTVTTANLAAFTLTAGQAYWLRARLIGTNLAIKCWQDGMAEPAAWSATTTDSAISGSGQYGLQAIVSTTATSVLVDNLYVVDYAFADVPLVPTDSITLSGTPIQPLALGLLKAASTTLPTATKLTNQLWPSAPVSSNATSIGSGAVGWGEVYGLGTVGAWAAASSQGAPSGNGALWDVTALEGQSLVVGGWTLQFRGALTTSGSITADVVMRVYAYHAGSSTYTLLGSSTLAAQTITSTFTTYTLPAFNPPATSFASGDKLYLDLWLHITANTTGGTTLKWADQGTGTATIQHVFTLGTYPTALVDNTRLGVGDSLLVGVGGWTPPADTLTFTDSYSVQGLATYQDVLVALDSLAAVTVPVPTVSDVVARFRDGAGTTARYRDGTGHVARYRDGVAAATFRTGITPAHFRDGAMTIQLP